MFKKIYKNIIYKIKPQYLGIPVSEKPNIKKIRPKKIKQTRSTNPLSKTSNIAVIKALVNDPNYLILENGVILTCVSKQGHTTKKWRLKHTFIHKDGYVQLSYFERKIRLHRVIFQKFHGDLIEDLEINHIDGNKLNNASSNLEQITRAENQAHATKLGLRRKKTG